MTTDAQSLNSQILPQTYSPIKKMRDIIGTPMIGKGA